MILDLANMFSGTVAVDGTKTGQAVTVTAISTNVVDLRQAALPALADEGISGPEIWLVIQVTQTVTAAGAATVVFSLESDSTADLATSPTVHFVTAAIGKAALPVNTFVVQTQMPSALTYERFLGVRYTVATGPLTAGLFLAYLTMDIQRTAHYAAGFTIDV